MADEDAKIIVTTAGLLGDHKTKTHFIFNLQDDFLFFSPHFLDLSARQQFIAIADYYGTLHILEIPWTLSHPSTNEVSNFWL